MMMNNAVMINPAQTPAHVLQYTLLNISKNDAVIADLSQSPVHVLQYALLIIPIKRSDNYYSNLWYASPRAQSMFCNEPC
jgi:hypothetical protein